MGRFIFNLLLAAFWMNISSSLFALDQLTIQKRLNQLRGMSAIERDRVDRNAKTFLAMTAEQKAHYRSLHDKIAEDARAGGSMGDLLDTYTHWLNSLTPAQRDQLQAEKDPGRKQVLVRQIMEERERQIRETIEANSKESKERTAVQENAASADPKRDSQPSFFERTISLDRKELDVVMGAIVDTLPEDKRSPYADKLPPVHEYPKIVRASIAATRNPEEWPDDDLLKKMEQSLRGAKSGVFQEIGRMGQAGREIAAAGILREIVIKARDNVYKPTEQDRLSALEDLMPFEKKRYDSLKSEKTQKEFLNHKFLEKRGDVSYSQAMDCRNNVLELYHELKIVPPLVVRPQVQRASIRKNKKP